MTLSNSKNYLENQQNIKENSEYCVHCFTEIPRKESIFYKGGVEFIIKFEIPVDFETNINEIYSRYKDKTIKVDTLSISVGKEEIEEILIDVESISFKKNDEKIVIAPKILNIEIHTKKKIIINMGINDFVSLLK